MDSNRYFSVYSLKDACMKQKFGYAKRRAIWTGIFYFKSCSVHITVDFKKLVSDLFHAGSPLVESECIKRKTRLSK